MLSKKSIGKTIENNHGNRQKIKDKKLQCVINRAAAKISALYQAR